MTSLAVPDPAVAPGLPAFRSVQTAVGELLLPADCSTITPWLAYTGEWDPEDASALQSLLRPGMTMVDIGAHVGYFALLAARAVGPGGRVVAIEADPDNFALLAANARRTAPGVLEAVHAAAWSTTGMIELTRAADGNSGDARLYHHAGSVRAVGVPAVRVDDVLGPRDQVDVVLLDTQGTEQMAMEGMRETIGRCRPRILAEFWPHGIREFGRDPSETLAIYREYGYRITALGVDGHEDADEAIVEIAQATAGGFCTLRLEPTQPTPTRPAAATPRLSICIPTHHGRRDTLARLLDSVESQVAPHVPEVDVSISDGGAEDGTDELVAERRDRGLVVSYHREGEDSGFPAHLLDAIERAEGEYCWLMSSDDAIEPGAVHRVLELLDAHPAALGATVSFQTYLPDLSGPVAAPYDFIYPPEAERPRVLADVEALIGQLGVILAYFPCQVVRRESFLAAAAELEAEGRSISRPFPHMDIIGRMAREGGEWVWSPRRLVRDRVGNDSWTPRRFGGDVTRYWACILGDLSRIYAEWLGAGSPAFRELMHRWYEGVSKPGHLALYKRQPTHTLRRDAEMLIEQARLFYFLPEFWRRSFPVLLTPHPLVSPAQAVGRGLRRARKRLRARAAPG
jgi:FkbM family methyltransferase